MVDRPHRGSRALTPEDRIGVSRFLTALPTSLPRASVAPMSSQPASPTAHAASTPQRTDHCMLPQLLADRTEGELRMPP